MPEIKLSKNLTEEHYVIKSKGLFVLAKPLKIHDSSFSFYLQIDENEFLSGEEISKILKHFCYEHKITLLDFQWSLIGQNKKIIIWEAALKALHVQICKTKIQEGLTEIHFWPKINKASLLQNNEINIPENKPEKTFLDANQKIKVMIVDDSITIQTLLKKLLSEDPLIEVVATIGNPLECEEALRIYKPDVLTLDIHMPKMDGITLLKKIHPQHAIPVLIVSSLNPDQGDYILNALENGAFDYIKKPELSETVELGAILREKIKAAFSSKRKLNTVVNSESKLIHKKNFSLDLNYTIAIGASTGGTEALREFLLGLPEKIPPILIVQHIPPVFSNAFAKRLDSLCPFLVKEAEDGDLVEANKVLIAPGGFQMRLIKAEKNPRVLTVRIEDTAPVNRHKPSVDALFFSLAQLELEKTIGIIMTGMGADGAKGLLSLRQKGARTIAQNEESCIVFGMPREAIELGAAEFVCDLKDISQTLMELTFSKKIA